MDNLINLETMDYGIFNRKGLPVVSSRKIAEVFNKRHDNVLQAIEKAECSDKFRNLNFQVSYYREGKGKYKEYLLTKDGFAFVVMGFTGKKAARFKEAYITRFNEMKEFIDNLEAARLEYPELTKVIAKLHKEPKRYHFSGEADLFNLIVLKARARDYKKAKSLPKVGSIRPYLKSEEVEAIMKLQRADIGLAMVIPEYDKRKELLQNYYNQLNSDKQLIDKRVS